MSVESKSSETAVPGEVFGGIVLILCLAALAWLAYVLYSPHRKLHDQQDLVGFEKARMAVAAVLKVRLTGSGDVLRMEPRGGDNLVIYLRKSDFESVLYPDGGEFVRAVGKAWCDNTYEDSHLFLPSVYIGDIRTGERLASYSCVFDRVSQ